LPQKLKHSLNRLLPQDIYIHKIKIVSDQFHARFSAKSKTYLYKIYLGNADVVFVHNLALAYSQKLALNTLRQAAKLFVGQHDFRSFSISTLDNTVRTINSLRITHQRD
jgi:tRNA pseudouridine38-40 synthase